MAKKQKKAKINKYVKCTVQCSCGDGSQCTYRKDKVKVQNFDVDICAKHLHRLGYKKIEEA